MPTTHFRRVSTTVQVFVSVTLRARSRIALDSTTGY